MTGPILAGLAVLTGVALAATSLARIQRETEELLDGYEALLAEARERHRREQEMRAPATKASAQDRTNATPKPKATDGASTV